MPQCFVIMPYGGNDDERRRHFDGVYFGIFKPAAETAGYECKRSDIAGEPGNITQDIIKDLATSEIVLADLTGGNPNVFLELGIRHVLRKSGTLHVIDENADIPFDVRAYRAVKYRTELVLSCEKACGLCPLVVSLSNREAALRQAQGDREPNLCYFIR